MLLASPFFFLWIRPSEFLTFVCTTMAYQVVQVEQGFIRGKECIHYQNGIYYSFYGIPYARPPLGKLRFMSPKPPDNWHGILDATKEKEGCISRHPITSEIVGNEDCLFLNVYTHQLTDSNRKKPVMVWIHGGAFSMGSANTNLYGPDFLITEDIVLVTVNYRLSVLGFLCIEDPSIGVPGNAALRDIIMSLKWVQKNIKQFNGDPDNVTVFGESSGAICIHYIMLSPLGKGLFHKVILQSATTLSNWSVGRKDTAKKLAKILGINSESDSEILEHLQNVPLNELFAAKEKLKIRISPHLLRTFFPVIENPHSIEAPVICEEPLEIIKKGNYVKVPMMLGYTSEEGLLFEPSVKRTKKYESIVTDLEDLVPRDLNLKRGSALSKRIALKIKEFYFGDKRITPENKAMYYRMMSDVFFSYAVLATVKYHAQNLERPIYVFRFSVDENLNLYKKLNNSNYPGACHSDELCYLFKMSITPKITPGSVENKTIKRMVKFWTNFARYGDPNSKEKNDLIDVVWKPVEGKTKNFLDIGRDLITRTNPDNERYEFWEDIYNMHPLISRL